MQQIVLKSDHLRNGPPSSQAFIDRNIFKSFFKERKIDVEPNTSGFVFFQAF